MNILHVIDSGGVYGAERVLLALSSECARRGHDCIIATLVSPDDDENLLMQEARALGLETAEFVMRDGLTLAAFRQVIQFANDKSIDVFHTHGYRANILSALSRHHAGYCKVTTLHGWTGIRRNSRLWAYELIDKLLLWRIDLVVTVCPMLFDGRVVRVLARNRQLIANGIKDQAIATNDGDDVDRFVAGHPAIAAAGRLSYEKGFDRLIEAFRQLLKENSDLRLVIFGEGDERVSLQDSIGQMGLQSHVLMPGFRKDIRRYLPSFQVFVLPSRTEGLPLVVLEAMFAGIAVVATDTGCVGWVLNDEAGVVVRDHDVTRGLGAAISEVLADSTARQKMGSAGARRAAQKFTAEAMAGRYLCAYDRATRGSG